MMWTLFAAAAVHASPATAHTVSGVVRDAQTNRPLSDALVQQVGSVASALTEPNGKFTVVLDPRGEASLAVSCAGYDMVTVKGVAGKAIVVALTPASAFDRAEPSSAAELEQAAAPAPGRAGAPFPSELTLAYRFRFEQASAGGASITGLNDNDFTAGGRWHRWGWLLEAEGGHFQAPTNVTGLATTDNPAYSPSAWWAGARFSRVFELNPQLALAAGVGYRWDDVVPNNRGIAYTGSPLDVEQTRHALGLVGQASWKPRPRLSFEALASAYPLVAAGTGGGSAFQNVIGDPTVYGNLLALDGRLEASYEVLPTLRVGLAYGVDVWQGNGQDVGQVLGIRLHYRPVGF